MATFANTAFNTALYSAVRPTYPRQLFQSIFQYHEKSKGSRWDLAVDIGCGTGQATRELDPFKRIVGVDPSAKMVKQAQESAAGSTDRSEYVVSAAEQLDFLVDNSVDLMISAQAIHWFDYAKFWPEVARTLKPGGTAAFWGYSEFRLPKYPNLTPLIYDYLQGEDLNKSLGPYWEQPGRSILNNLFREVPSPTDVVPDKFTDFQRIYYTSPYHEDVPSPRPVILNKRVTWDQFLAWLRTSSALHTFHEKFPEDLKHPEGDISARFWKSIKDGVEKQEGRAVKDDDQLQLDWPLTLLLVKRV